VSLAILVISHTVQQTHYAYHFRGRLVPVMSSSTVREMQTRMSAWHGGFAVGFTAGGLAGLVFAMTQFPAVTEGAAWVLAIAAILLYCTTGKTYRMDAHNTAYIIESERRSSQSVHTSRYPPEENADN
jgi:hypothetical protein